MQRNLLGGTRPQHGEYTLLTSAKRTCQGREGYGYRVWWSCSWPV